MATLLDLYVPSLPTRDGKRKSCTGSPATAGFPAYLQGMERDTNRPVSRSRYRVPSLPTRDGKHIRPEECTLVKDRSQPTYKGWKVIRFSTVCLLGHRVPSLPTRDGKPNGAPKTTFTNPRFPAYLQGMERWFPVHQVEGRPSSQPTYKGWKGRRSSTGVFARRVPSLPTRDGK